MFKQITYKVYDSVSNIYLQFGEGCNISCSGFIIGEYETIGRFLNGEDSRLFIDSTKL